MKRGYLSQYFEGAAVKKLSAVEVGGANSNQHEFQGVSGLRDILGVPEEKTTFETKFLFLFDGDDLPIFEEGFMTWSDVRRNKPNRSAEYHLYYSSGFVSQYANPGDLLLIAKRPDNTLLTIITESETTISQQILWLFGFSDISHPGFSVREELETEQDRVEFASRIILENIGIEIEVTEETWLDDILNKFNGKFPTTREFSAYARSSLPDIHPQDGHDAVLMAWMEREEILFRTLEKHLIGERLSQGFDGDVDGFISFSLSVQNRRKSRAGLAFENHLEILFQECDIHYTRTPKTESKSKPDFIFPGIDEYRDTNFNPLNLTMLGVKSSCKDRWRQVLVEADRIDRKHLLTLEAAISKNQTDEMKSKDLQLVLPAELHSTYSSVQQEWLMNVLEFTELVLERQQ